MIPSRHFGQFAGVAIAGLALCFALQAHAGGTFVTFSVPGADAGTLPTSINANGDVAGAYYVYEQDAPGLPEIGHGFVRAADGTITPFDPPGSANTNVSGMNDAGEIAGYYEDQSNNNHGFLRTPDGKIEIVDGPGATGGTSVNAINAKGVAVGGFSDSNGGHGFVLNRAGKFKIFDVPSSSATTPLAINVKGWIAGEFSTEAGSQGFVRAPDGTIATFEPTGAKFTEPLSINVKGEITGTYNDSTGFHGFLRAPHGTIVTFDVFDVGGTFSHAVNDHGVIAGQAGISKTFAFVRSRKDNVTKLDPPKSYLSSANGINNAGVITGYFYTDDTSDGFIWSR